MDIGTLGAIGEFGKGFLQTYMTTRAQRENEKQNALARALQAKTSGFVQSADGTDWEMTPEKLEQVGLDRKYKEAQIGELENRHLDQGLDRDYKRAQIGKINSEIREKQSETLVPNFGKLDDRLPIESQEFIKTTGTKISNASAIKNAIHSALEQLEGNNVSPDQKIVLSRQILKTLNSQQGSDAIGSEEAKRLGGLLEFKIMPNLTEPGPMFGRDVGGFLEQVRNTKGQLESTIKKSREDIVNERARYGMVTPGEVASQKPSFEPDVLEYAKIHKISPEQAQGIKLQRTSQVNAGAR